MVNNMFSREWIKQNSEKLKNTYSYAVVNKLNTKSKEDVLTILKEIDPENANEEYAVSLSKVLQLMEKSLKNTLEKRIDEGKI